MQKSCFKYMGQSNDIVLKLFAQNFESMMSIVEFYFNVII